MGVEVGNHVKCLLSILSRTRENNLGSLHRQ